MHRTAWVVLLLVAGLGPSSPPPSKAEGNQCTGEDPSWQSYKEQREEADRVAKEGGLVIFDMKPWPDPEPDPGSHEAPELPPSARGACVTGEAVVQYEVGIDGDVVDGEVLHEHPDGLGFGQAALRAVETWRFEPARLREDGCPVAVLQVVRLTFAPDCPSGE